MERWRGDRDGGMERDGGIEIDGVIERWSDREME